MSHPPVLAVTIAAILAAATLADAYRSAQLPGPAAAPEGRITATPIVQLSRALQALRVDIESDGVAPAM